MLPLYPAMAPKVPATANSPADVEWTRHRARLADRETNLGLIRDQQREAGIRVLAWCLMTNHVHWVVVP